MTLPVLWGFPHAKSSSSRTWYKTPSFILSLLGTFLLTSVLIFSKSRSGQIAALIATAIMAAYAAYHWLASNQKTKPKTITASILALVATTLIFGSEYTPSISDLATKITTNQITTKPKQNPNKAQIPLIAQGGTESGDIRKIVWSGALDMFRARPLFGFGVETFAYSYYSFRPVEHNIISEWDFLYNKAHNEILNLAANTGIFGVTSYLAILATFAAFVLSNTVVPQLKVFKTKSFSASDRQLLFSLLVGLIAVSASNTLGFSTVTVGMFLFIYLAFGISLTQTKSVAELSSQKPLTITRWLTATISVTIGLALFAGNAVIFASDFVYQQASTANSRGDLNRAINKFHQALSLNPFETKISNDFADTLSQASLAHANAGNDAVSVSLAQLAFQQSANTLEKNPVHLNNYKTQAGVFIRLSVLDPSLLEVASTILEDSISLAPTDAKLYYNLGLIKLDQEATESARTYLEEAVKLKPNYQSARLTLAELYQSQGETTKANKQASYILRFLSPQNTAAKEILNATSTN